MHAKECIGRAANQYSCFNYTAWVETLYTGIGLKTILLSLHEQNYNDKTAKYAFRCLSLAIIPISYSHDRYFSELKLCTVFSTILFFPCINEILIKKIKGSIYKSIMLLYAKNTYSRLLIESWLWIMSTHVRNPLKFWLEILKQTIGVPIDWKGRITYIKSHMATHRFSFPGAAASLITYISSLLLQSNIITAASSVFLFRNSVKFGSSASTPQFFSSCTF